MLGQNGKKHTKRKPNLTNTTTTLV